MWSFIKEQTLLFDGNIGSEYILPLIKRRKDGFRGQLGYSGALGKDKQMQNDSTNIVQPSFFNTEVNRSKGSID